MGGIETPAPLADAGPARSVVAGEWCWLPGIPAIVFAWRRGFPADQVRRHRAWRRGIVLAWAVVRPQGGWAGPSDCLDGRPGQGPAFSHHDPMLVPSGGAVRCGFRSAVIVILDHNVAAANCEPRALPRADSAGPAA